MRENRLLEPERLTAVEMLARKDDGSAALIAIERTTTVREALRLMTEHDISQLPVCELDECVGSVPESLLMSRIIEDPATLDQAVDEIMEAPFPVIDADLPMSRIGRLLTRQCPAVLVRTNGELGGIITRYDMVRYLTT
jgi:cystathionine beta-synthase